MREKYKLLTFRAECITYDTSGARMLGVIFQEEKINKDRKYHMWYKEIEEFWNTVIFSDENKFNLFGSGGCKIVWRGVILQSLAVSNLATIKLGVYL